VSTGHPGPVRIGVALGGGAVRGAAHIGVLGALCDAGLPPTVVAGTSVGAVVGALYAAGVDAPRIAYLAATMRWTRLVRPTVTRHAMFDPSGLAGFLDDALGGRDFADLAHPFAAVATELTTGGAVVLRTGPVTSAVMASSAIPGVFPPVVRDGRVLVDGGLVDLVPARLARTLGADIVIAVDVSGQSPHRAPSSLLQILVATTHLPAGVAARLAVEADVVLAPDVDEYAIWELSRIAEFEKAGRVAAERAVPLVRALVAVAEARREFSVSREMR
jgi:NTE family protein